MTKRRRKGRINAELRIENYLTRRTIRSLATAVTTTNIASAVNLPNDKTWRTLDTMCGKNIVNRYPSKKTGRRHFLMNSITRQRYYGRSMRRLFAEFVQELLKRAIATASILAVLECTLDDIKSLTDLGRDLGRYNAYLTTLRNSGLVMRLPRLLWRSDAIRWWLT